MSGQSCLAACFGMDAQCWWWSWNACRPAWPSTRPPPEPTNSDAGRNTQPGSCYIDSWDVIVLGSGSTRLSKCDATANREVPARVARGLPADGLCRLERCRFVRVLP